MAEHPIRIRVDDDLARSRLTVFFRLLLAIPHLFWVGVYGLAALVVAVVAWFTALFTGSVRADMHRFIASWVRYAVHVYAYLLLAANPYPGFLGNRPYPVDVEIAPPQRHNRWKTGFRLILAIPVLAFGAGLPTANVSSRGRLTGAGGQGAVSAVSGIAAFLGWFACLARGRMPRGLRDAAVYSIGYTAQVNGYTLLLTDRYPNSDPAALLGTGGTADHPIRIAVADDLRRSRLTTFFRLPLVVPLYVWGVLWGIVAVLAAIASWIATLARGSSPAALHRFLAAYVRYQVHVVAFLYLTANPFPGFTGAPGTYPIEVAVDPPARQNRWKTGFRLILAFPAFLLASAYGSVLTVAAVGAWFAALFTARMPGGLRNIGVVALRYSAQTYAYLFLLTDRYPYGGPTDEALAAAPGTAIPPPPPPPPPPA